MYQPPHFREDDLGVQHALIRAHPLGMLITAGASGLMANPLPFLLEAAPGKGVLKAHMAKANQQWREIGDGAPALVVFQGVDSYVTPSWYATKQETGKVVPTWNYAIVQVRGPARIVDDAQWLRSQIEALTGEHENGRPSPWTVGDAPEPFVAAQIKGIIGIEIEIADIDGKWKVSQNRPAADVSGVVTGLREDGQPHLNPEMADLVGRYGGS